MIKTKAAATCEELGDCYCLVGPYNENSVKTEVEVADCEVGVIREAIEAMRAQGVDVSDCFCLRSEFHVFEHVGADREWALAYRGKSKRRSFCAQHVLLASRRMEKGILGGKSHRRAASRPGRERRNSLRLSSHVVHRRSNSRVN